MKIAVISFLVLAFFAPASLRRREGSGHALPKDKCPVCGMFVKKYPDWVSQIVFKDGSYAVFDGAKDLFKYYHGLKKYNPSHAPSDIDSIYVTDYYRAATDRRVCGVLRHRERRLRPDGAGADTVRKS